MRLLLIFSLCFFSLSLFCDEKSDQDLSLLEALEQFYKKNGGSLENLKLEKDKEPVKEVESSLKNILGALREEHSSENTTKENKE